MLVLNIVILLLFVIGYIYSMKNTLEWLKCIDKKEHKLYVIYPMADFILTKVGLEKILNRKEQVSERIKALYVTSKPETQQKLFWCSKVSLIIAILVLFNLLSLVAQLQSTSNSIILEEKYIMRPNYGEGSEEVELKVILEKTTDLDTNEKDILTHSQEFKIRVEEQAYSKEELSKIFVEAIQYLKIDVLGNNESKDTIYENLKFCKRIPGTSIAVEWKPENFNLIKTNGTVNNEGFGTEGITTRVTAMLSYREDKIEHSMTFHIMPKPPKEEELLRKNLEEEIRASAEKTGEENRLELPDTIENYRLSWTEKETNTGATLLFMGVLLALIAWLFGDKELDNQMRKRKEQMLLDYPEIINKFTLLINAGMTVKQAWNKIVEDYSTKFTYKYSKKRYAYEEMIATAHELKLGMTEGIAYEQYGRRIGLIPYIKFSSLIAQNIKKGNKGFAELLTKEAIEAFEERKEMAKRLGEEAGTKLLAPMMIMLLIVLLMILIPAFRSFGI